MKQLTPRWIALVTITAITLYVAWLIIEPFVNVILWALVLTVIAYPIQTRITRHSRSPTLSAALTLCVVLLLVVLPLTVLGQAIVARSDEAVATFQVATEKLTNPESPHLKWLSERFHINIKEYLGGESFAAQASRLAGILAGYSTQIVSWTAVFVVQFLLVLFTTFYMLRDGGKLLLSVRNFLPLKKNQADSIFESVKTIISASLRGTVLIAVIQGLLGGLAFWVLGIPAALLWGVAMFFTAIVPVVGSSLVWVPAAIYLATSDSWVKGLLLTIWGVGVISMVDNLLRPIFVGSKTRMHELTVFFSVLGGMKVFGPVGIVVGPIVIALAFGLMRIFEETVHEYDEDQLNPVEGAPVKYAAEPTATPVAPPAPVPADNGTAGSIVS